MNRAAVWATLAGDVIVRAARTRLLGVYLVLVTLVVALAVFGADIERVGPPSGEASSAAVDSGQAVGTSPPEDAGDDPPGWRLTFCGQPVRSGVDRPAAVARPALLLAWYYLVLVWGAGSLFGVILGLMATCDAVSSAFAPGRAELILPRPVTRAEVVVARFLGALGFAGICTSWMCALAFLGAGFKFGLWQPGFLLAAPALLAKFAVLLAIATLVIVLTRLWPLGLAASGCAWLASYLVNHLRLSIEDAKAKGADAPLRSLEDQITWAQRLLPQIPHQDVLAGYACAQPAEIPYLQLSTVLFQGVFWTVVPLALTVFVVSRRDQ